MFLARPSADVSTYFKRGRDENSKKDAFRLVAARLLSGYAFERRKKRAYLYNAKNPLVISFFQRQIPVVIHKKIYYACGYASVFFDYVYRAACLLAYLARGEIARQRGGSIKVAYIRVGKKRARLRTARGGERHFGRVAVIAYHNFVFFYQLVLSNAA